MARAYLDINIFRQVEDPAIWHAIRRNLRAGGHRVIVGDAIIGEAIRLDDPAVRARQLRCICGLRSEWTAGVPGEAMVTETYRLLIRARPDWVVGTHRVRLLRELRGNRKQALTNIANNPAQQELWNRNLSPTIKFQAESIREWQKAAVRAIKKATYRRVLAENVPMGVRLPPTLSDAELQWRLLAAERLYALTNGLSTEPVDYFVDVRRGVSASEWSLLWLEDAQIVQTPATAVHGLVRYHQLFASLKGVGNMIDAMHATESVGCDFFVTSDENLAGILEAVRVETSGVSPAPRWIQSGTVSPSALDAALH